MSARGPAAGVGADTRPAGGRQRAFKRRLLASSARGTARFPSQTRMSFAPLRVLLVAGVLFATPAFAQDDAARALDAMDLTVPQESIRFQGAGTSDHRNDPPGTWYGDHGGRALPRDDGAAPSGDWHVHGSVEAGIGWSSRGGNSNWQGANVNLGRTYVDDEGDTGRVNIDISVGRGEGPAYGPGYFAPEPLDAPMLRGRPPQR